jgi:hypothetical protein
MLWVRNTGNQARQRRLHASGEQQICAPVGRCGVDGVSGCDVGGVSGCLGEKEDVVMAGESKDVSNLLGLGLTVPRLFKQ